MINLLNRYRIPIASGIAGANLSLGVSTAMEGRMLASTISFGVAVFLVVMVVRLEMLEFGIEILEAMKSDQESK